MGVKFFYKWLQDTFGENIIYIKNGENIPSKNIHIDTLAIDLNGIIHNSCQKIYKYGSYKPEKKLLHIKNSLKNGNKNNVEIISKKPINRNIEVYEDICKEILSLYNSVKPAKRLFIAIDGVAPLAKQNQQRQRRFRAVKEMDPETFKIFDSTCISPGTIFMKELSEYIDYYFHLNINNGIFSEVIFTPSSNPGEGEHKAIKYLRGLPQEETSCVYANDADLIFLCMSLHKKVYVIRDSMYDKRWRYHLLDIPLLGDSIYENMKFNDENHSLIKERVIDDFIFLMFFVGNDFLPNIIAMEILENGIFLLFSIYIISCEKYGHILIKTNNGLKIRRKSLQGFLREFSNKERDILENKYIKKTVYFEDNLLENCMEYSINENKYNLQLEKYKKLYYSKKMGIEDISKACEEYLIGMQWVLEYYSKGCRDNSWFYQYDYAPFASDLAKYMGKYNHKEFNSIDPVPPFLQLSIILPPKSYSLLPPIFRENRAIREFCPDEFHIDLSGKRREWEGIVILPKINMEIYTNNYNSKIDDVSQRDLERNNPGKSWVYTHSDIEKLYISPLGMKIPNCRVNNKEIVL